MRNIFSRILPLLLTLVLVLAAVPAMAADAPALPTATTTEIENDELTFAMNFKADTVTDEQLEYYGDWYADFELTFNKDVTLNANGTADGWLSGQYDSWSENWVNVPPKDVTLKANEPLKIMAYAAELYGEAGLKYTYKEVYESVKDFDCGVYLDEDFIYANPDVVITLALKTYNNENEAETYVIGEAYTFSFNFVARNTSTKVLYEDVSDAMTAAQAGQTVELIKDANDTIVSVFNDTKLDLNGYTLTADYFTCYGHTVDSSAENTGLLVVKNTMFNDKNLQMPIYDGTGYRFFEVQALPHAFDTDGSYAFLVYIEQGAHELIKAGTASSQLEILVNVSWTQGDTIRSQRFVYVDSIVKTFFDSYVASNKYYTEMLTLLIANADSYENLTYDCGVHSLLGVARMSSDPAQGGAETENNTLTEDVTLTHNQNSAVVAEGTLLESGATELVLTATEMTKTESNIQLGDGEQMLSMDVHVDGISADNTVPVIVTLNDITVAGLNEGNIALYHVEDGVTTEMTRVYSLAEVDEHNEYYYDIATGTLTMALKSFSEIAVVADEENAWNGNIDTSWYNTTATTFEIFNADQLAGLGSLVDGGNTFEGKTVRMMLSVNLGGDKDNETGPLFNPIGYGYEFNGGNVFKGTFDGNGNTVYNLFQHGWSMETEGEDYTYSMAGAGLFASVVDATIKNLTMDGAYVVMECVDMGVVVGYANGDCTFENIVVKNSIIGNYQRATGGAIGELGGGGTYTLNNVDVEASTTVSSLWGDFDAPLGGIVGAVWHNAGTYLESKDTTLSVNMVNCDSAAVINAYNDVTSAYQWYSYRRAGMLIGNSEESETSNGRTEATAPYLTTVDCTVQYGDWANYHYCEFGDTTSMSARYPWVRVEAGFHNGAYSNARYGVPTFDGKTLDVENHTETDGCHVSGDGHDLLITFRQLYGGGQGCYGGNAHVDEFMGVEEIGYTVPAQKFEKKDISTIYNTDGSDIVLKLSDLFAVKSGVEIQASSVHAFVSPATKDDSVRATFSKVGPSEAWYDETLTFTGTGTAVVSISDYYYCEPTVLILTIKDHYYTVTYVGDLKDGQGERELYVHKVTNNQSAFSDWYKIPDTDASTYQWVNTGSTAAAPIEAGNTADVVLYLDWADTYTVRYLNQDGTLYQAYTFNNQTGELDNGATEPAVPEVSGLEIVGWEEYTLKGATGDVSVRPVYKINDYVQLTPHDTDSDGVTDYYSVTGSNITTEGQTIVIPESVNGIPVIEIETGAFADGKVANIYVPSSIETIGENAFTANSWREYPMIQIYFDGTKAQWDAIEKTSGEWDDNIGTGSTIICSDNTATRNGVNGLYASWSWSN